MQLLEFVSHLKYDSKIIIKVKQYNNTLLELPNHKVFSELCENQPLADSIVNNFNFDNDVFGVKHLIIEVERYQ